MVQQKYFPPPACPSEGRDYHYLAHKSFVSTIQILFLWIRAHSSEQRQQSNFNSEIKIQLMWNVQIDSETGTLKFEIFPTFKIS